MKIKVLKSFIDKYDNKKIYKIGEIIECTEERLAEIQSVDKDLVTVWTEEVTVKKTKKKTETE